MKIAVNTRLLLHNKLEGIGWFTHESLKRITQQHPEHEFVFLFDRPYSEEFIYAKNVTPIVIAPQARHPLLWYIWFEFSVSKILKKHKVDLFLSTDGFLSLASKVPSVVVMHDLNFEYYPKDLAATHSKFYRKYFPLYAQKANRVATVSEYSKRDINKCYEVSLNKIDVVYNGCNDLYKPVSTEIKKATQEKYTQGCDYFLFVGALHPRKNIARLFKAFDEFKNQSKSNFKLVIVGAKKWWTQDIKAAYDTMKHQQDVVFAGRLNPDELKNILASAHALTYIPYFEGFGIPIVEAMNCDVPVIAGNLTAMPEIAGDAALLVDPFDIKSITSAMLQLATNNDLREKLIAKARIQKDKFSWQQTADKLWACMEKVMKEI